MHVIIDYVKLSYYNSIHDIICLSLKSWSLMKYINTVHYLSPKLSFFLKADYYEHKQWKFSYTYHSHDTPT